MCSVLTDGDVVTLESPWALGAPAYVVCVGNELARDDGVGIRVGRVLRELPLPEWVTVSFYQELGLGLVELLASGERVVIVDAMAKGGTPGTCCVLDADELARSTRGVESCHAFGMAEMLAIARELSGAGQLAWVRFVGIEVEDVAGFGTKLTPAVAGGLPDAVAKVLEILGAPAALVQMGRELATRAPTELPLAELHAG